jgi:hypothetical protein
MKTEKANATVYHYEHVPLQSSKHIIDRATYPMPAEERQHIERLVEEESETVASAYLEKVSRELQDAIAARDSLASLRERSREDLEAAEERSREADREPPSSWIKALIAAFCAAACFVAEFVLTWHALTWLLNVERDSPLGILLGLAPPCALAVLELVVARLFEEPWRKLRPPYEMPRWRRVLTVTSMVLLLTGLAWGNVHTILLLAAAREEAAKSQHLPVEDQWDESAAPAMIDQVVVSKAILAVSVCVTVDGAVFLLIALLESQALWRRRQARRAVAHCRAQADRVEMEHRRAGGSVASLEEGRDRWDADSRSLAERFRSQCLYELDSNVNRSRRSLSTGKFVDLTLRERVPV